MKTPRVSVVVATYRREESLRRALQSLQEQVYPQVEIIVVDDNDDPVWNERVKAIVREVHLPVVLLVNHPNLGSARARNRGIEAATGEYITFLDDDDIYLPEKISRQVVAMVQENADYSITDLNLFNERDRCIEKRSREYIHSNQPEDLLRCHLMHHMTGTDTFMFRSGYLRQIGGFPHIDVGDEFYLMVQAITGGGKFCHVPGCDVKAYVHTGENGGLSSGESKICGENALYLYKKKFFGKLNAKSRRYIRMRHHAVLAFAGIRMRKLIFTLKHAMCSFLSSPAGCCKLVLKRKV